MSFIATKGEETIAQEAPAAKGGEASVTVYPVSNDAIVRLINGARAEVRSYRTLYFTFQGVAFLLPGLVHSNILEHLSVRSPLSLQLVAYGIVFCWVLGVLLLTRGLLAILPVTTSRSNLRTSCDYRVKSIRFLDGIRFSARRAVAAESESSELSVVTSLWNAALIADPPMARRELVKALDEQHRIMQRVAATRRIFLWGVGLLALGVCLSFVFRVFCLLVGPM